MANEPPTAKNVATQTVQTNSNKLPQEQQEQVELFAAITFKIRQSLQLKEILHTIVTEVQKVLQADRVLIYQVLPDGTGKPISEAVLPAYQAILGMEFPEEVFPIEYQQLYAQGRVRAVADMRDPNEAVADCLIEFVEQFAVKAKLIVPILHSLSVHPPESHPPTTLIWGLLIAHHFVRCNDARNGWNCHLQTTAIQSPHRQDSGDFFDGKGAKCRTQAV